MFKDSLSTLFLRNSNVLSLTTTDSLIFRRLKQTKQKQKAKNCSVLLYLMVLVSFIYQKYYD